MASPLKIAKGLGSAKTGLHHWWLQRMTIIPRSQFRKFHFGTEVTKVQQIYQS